MTVQVCDSALLRSDRVGARMDKLRMLRLLQILLGIGLVEACAVAEPVVISIFPTHYTVAGERFTDPKAAVIRAAARSPDRLSLRICATVVHKRVVEVSALLQQEFKGHLMISTINAGEGDCPGHSSHSDLRQESGARP